MSGKIPNTRNNLGFTLLTVLVAAAIGGVIIFSMLRFVTQSQRAQRQIASRSTLRTFVDQIEMFVKVPQACKGYFETKQFNPTPATLSSQEVTGIQITLPLDSTKIFAQGGTTLNDGVELQSVVLKDFLKVANTSYIAQLTIAATLSNGVQVSRQIPVGLETTNINAATEEIVQCNRAERFTRITAVVQGNHADIVSSNSAVSSLVNCPTGYTLINYGVERCRCSDHADTPGTNGWCYCECLKSGNGIISRLQLNSAFTNANLSSFCFGLCMKN